MIYLDNAATTKPDRECLAQAEIYLTEKYFNPSALYRGGYELHTELRQMHENLVSTIGDPRQWEVVMTSCGTEADNQAIFCGGKRGNIVTTLGEHSAIHAAVNEAKQRGMEVRFADLKADGDVDEERLLSLVDDKTSLVSVIHVNNETGAVNDIDRLATAVKQINPRALFHSDGVQAFGKLPYRLGKDVDLYSISAHKIGALKGTGALFKKKSVTLKPYIWGGGQENQLRSGTENVFGIKMLELAAQKKYARIRQNFDFVQSLKTTLWQSLDKTLFVPISGENATPYILTVGAIGVRGETILHEADDRGICIGTGSACSSNEKKRFSRVILACGLSDMADGVLRISFSSDNTVEEIRQAAFVLNEVVRHRKEMME